MPLDNLRGQLFYLDFDGKSVDYNGPVTVKNIDGAGFRAAGSLTGHEQSLINDITID